MYANHYENPRMLSRVTAKNDEDVFLRHTVVVAVAAAAAAAVVILVVVVVAAAVVVGLVSLLTE